MLSFVSSKGSSKPPVLFDIRINKTNSSTSGGDNDVLIFKGAPDESSSVLLTGNIVLSITEPMYIKSMYLKMYGDVRIKIPVVFHTQKGDPITRISRFDKRFYEHTWGNSNFKHYLSNMYDNSSNNRSTGVMISNHMDTGNADSSNSNDTQQESTSATPATHPTALNKNRFKAKSTTNIKRFGSSLSSSSSASISSMNKSKFNSSVDNHSSTNLNLKSSSSQSSLNGNFSSSSSSSSSSQTAHLLVKGNYEFPFSIILPGNTVESVEGLPSGCCVYKLQAVIERGKFQSDLQVKKHIRIIRTHNADSMDLSETVAVDNCWPKKVEYTISTPAKSVIIGSSIPIHMVLVPIAKGLKLGTVKCSLIENSAICSPYGEPYQQERIIAKNKTPNPLKTNRDMNYFRNSDYTNHQHDENSMNVNIDDQGEFQDKWEVTLYLDTPTSLSKCTQDCTIITYLRVRHKLKFVISLINADGHVSELRASLPIQLFISPFVPISCKSVDPLDSHSRPASANTSDVEEDANTNSTGNGNGGSGLLRSGNSNTSLNGSRHLIPDGEDDTVLFDSSTTLLYDSVVNAINTKSNDNLAAIAYSKNGQSMPELMHSASSPQVNSMLNVPPSALTNTEDNNRSSTPVNSSVDLLAYSRQHSSIVLTSLLVPPNYDNRVYDRLWNGVNYIESTPSTPVPGRVGSGTDLAGNNPEEGLDLTKLQNGLEILQMERAQDGDVPVLETPQVLQTQPSDYFSQLNGTNVPTTQHFSRTNSFVKNTPDAETAPPTASSWQKNLGSMARVPSYRDTMKANATGDQIDLPPVYDPEDYEKNHSGMDDHLLKRPKQTRSRGSSIDNMSAFSLTNLRRNSSGASVNKNSSTENVSDLGDGGLVMGKQTRPNFISGMTNGDSQDKPSFLGHQRTSSNSSLFRKSNTVTKQFGFGMTPLHQQASSSSSTSVDQQLPPRLSNKNKSRSFTSLLGFGNGQK